MRARAHPLRRRVRRDVAAGARRSRAGAPRDRRYAFGMDADHRRQELLGWIEKTKRNMRTLAIILVPLTAAAIGLLVWKKTFGVFAMIGVVSLAICGFWVMAAHNAAHYQKLAELDAAARKARRAASQ